MELAEPLHCFLLTVTDAILGSPQRPAARRDMVPMALHYRCPALGIPVVVFRACMPTQTVAHRIRHL